jgi:hypothetical protein
LGAGVVLALSQTAALVLYVFWLRRAYPGEPVDIRSLGENGPLIAIATLISVPPLLGFLAFAIRRARGRFGAYLAFSWPGWRAAGWSLLGLCAVLALESLASMLAGLETPSFMTGAFDSAQTAGMIPLITFAFVLAAPLGEETLFRGFLYRGLAERLGPPTAIVLTSIVWALMHVQYAWFFMAEIFVLGLYLGAVRWKTGSTLLTFLLHACVNGLAMIGLAMGGP